MKEHRCVEFKKAVAGLWSDNDDWEIKGKNIIARGEYMIRIKYCPFCGEKL
jgi:hypothetical protein